MNENTEDNVFRNNPMKCIYMLIWGIVVWCIFLSACHNEGGMYNFQDVFQDIMLALVIVITIVVIYFVLPVQITVYDEYVIYHKTFFKEKKVYWHYYHSANNGVIKVASFIPILWCYSINYVDSQKEKHHLYCGMFSGADFSKLSEQFVDKKYEIELSKNTQIYYDMNPEFATTKKIQVPQKEIKKKLFLPCKIALFITVLIFVTEMMQGWADSESKEINMDTDVLIFLPIMILLFFSVPIYMYIRQKIVYPRIPSTILLQPEWMEIDGVEFLFSGITQGAILYGDSVGKRILSFVYEGKKYKYYFGTVKENKEDLFPQYRELSDYLQNKGFEAQIYTFQK